MDRNSGGSVTVQSGRPRNMIPRIPFSPNPRLSNSAFHSTARKAYKEDETVGETPERLKLLEVGWRARRKSVIGKGKVDTDLEIEIKDMERGNRQKESNPLGAQEPLIRRARRVSLSDSRPTPMLTTVPPLTPPPSPIVGHEKKPLPQHNRPLSSVAGDRMKPIVKGALPSTFRPVTLPDKTSTIQILPYSSVAEMIIETKDALQINVKNQGKSMDCMHHGRVLTRLKLLDLAKWDESQLKQWETVWQLIEGYKRVTPRIRIWHDLGTLTITCSEPPDIILSFEIGSTSSPRTTSRDNEGSILSCQPTRVKVKYSLSTSTFHIDTYSITASPRYTKPHDTLRTKRKMIMASINAEAVLTDVPDDITLACKAFGIRLMKWREEEIEGIRRLWRLRPEWERYVIEN